MSNILLSINIPTFNRASYLHGLLLSIFESKPFSDIDCLEVNVLDNASEDNTSFVAAEFAKYNNFNYIQNPINVGPMKNIQMAHRVGSGKYVWVIGDDDYLIENKLQEIVSFLNQSPDVLLLSYVRKTPTGESVGIVTSWSSSCFLTKNDPLFRLDYADKLIGFLSANIIRRDWVNSINDEEYEHLDEVGELAHASMIYKAIGSGGTLAYIAEPTIVQTVDNGYLRYDYWRKVCFDYCVELPKFLITIGFGTDQYSVESFFQSRLRKEIFRRVISDKYRDKSYLELLNDRDVRKFLSWRFYILRLISFIPNALIVSIYDAVFTKRQ
ncbi:glycosyltransferase family 2 protein [Aeromonas veronii]